MVKSVEIGQICQHVNLTNEFIPAAAVCVLALIADIQPYKDKVGTCQDKAIVVVSYLTPTDTSVIVVVVLILITAINATTAAAAVHILCMNAGHGKCLTKDVPASSIIIAADGNSSDYTVVIVIIVVVIAAVAAASADQHITPHIWKSACKEFVHVYR